MAREANLRRNVEKSFGVIWDQCSTALQSTIKVRSEYDDSFDDLDTVWLVKELEKTTYGIDRNSYAEMNLLDTIWRSVADRKSVL